MPSTPDFSDFSEDELQDVIAVASLRLEKLREDSAREAARGPTGSKGQDVRNPAHGAIAAPTPNEVEEIAPAHGVDSIGLTADVSSIDNTDLDRAGKAIDEGLSYAAPTVDAQRRGNIEQAFEDLDHEDGVPRAG